MPRVAAEFQYVPLRDAHMLEEHPGCMRKIRNLGACKLHRPVPHCVVEIGVGSAAAEQVEQMIAQRSIRRRRRLASLL
jgi:hypothetical protein